jgi:hypothetical protein
MTDIKQATNGSQKYMGRSILQKISVCTDYYLVEYVVCKKLCPQKNNYAPSVLKCKARLTLHGL